MAYQTDCPVCGAAVSYTVSRFYPETRWEPAGGGEIEDITPECDCSELRCVNESDYYDWIVERIMDNPRERDDDGDARYDAWKDEQLERGIR